MIFKIADKEFSSRLLLGTGKFSNNNIMIEAIKASGTQIVTVALKRANPHQVDGDDIFKALKTIPNLQLLPNTSGVRNAKEAIFAAELAREAFETDWLKLEIHPDPRYLMPDPIETLIAATELVKRGFVVLPYIHADPVLCKRLEDIGIPAVMPLGAPIGSNLGLSSLDFLKIIIEQSNVPVIVDAGIGLPSHACMALELGASAVLVNTAIATAQHPVAMSEAFKLATMAGGVAYNAIPPQAQLRAEASSPFTKFLESL
jgi:thiazole synthase